MTTTLSLPNATYVTGMFIRLEDDTVAVCENLHIFDTVSKAKSLAQLLFGIPLTLDWPEQDKGSLNAFVSLANKNFRLYGRSLCLLRAVIKGQINPGDVVEQLKTKRIQGREPILLWPKCAKDIDTFFDLIKRSDYSINISLKRASTSNVPRTIEAVDLTHLESLDLSNSNLVQEVRDWDAFVGRLLSHLPILNFLNLDENGLGRKFCEALAKMLKQCSCKLQRLFLKRNNLDDRCIEVLAPALLANKTLLRLHLASNDQVTPRGIELLSQLLGNLDTPSSTYNSNHTLAHIDISGKASDLARLNLKKNAAKKKIWFLHYETKEFDVGPFLGLEVGMIPYLLAWFGVTENKDGVSNYQGQQSAMTDKRRFNIFYQIVRHWNVEALIGNLSPMKARNLELEALIASAREENRVLKATMGEEIRALKSEVAELKKKNRDLLRKGGSKRKRVT